MITHTMHCVPPSLAFPFQFIVVVVVFPNRIGFLFPFPPFFRQCVRDIRSPPLMLWFTAAHRFSIFSPHVLSDATSLDFFSALYTLINALVTTIYSTCRRFLLLLLGCLSIDAGCLFFCSLPGLIHDYYVFMLVKRPSGTEGIHRNCRT